MIISAPAEYFIVHPLMTPVDLSAHFQGSLRKFLQYPTNLVNHHHPWSSEFAAKRYHHRLVELGKSLCVQTEEDVELAYREYDTASGRPLDKRNIHSAQKLSAWLGIEQSIKDGDSSPVNIRVSGRDPKCRSIFLYGLNSRSPLNITEEMLALTLTFHEVMPEYLDYLFVFGSQSGPRDLRFSGFKEQVTLSALQNNQAMHDLGRSGRGFQMCYNIKGVSHKAHNAENARLDEWSVRQAAIHHRLDIVHGTGVWIVAKGNNDLQQRYKEVTAGDHHSSYTDFTTAEACFRTSLGTHTIYLQWSTEGWPSYINWIESIVEGESDIAVIGPRGPGYAHKQYAPYHIQDLQFWQDKAGDAIMAIDTNMDILRSLKRFYNRLINLRDFPTDLKEAACYDVAQFEYRLGGIIEDFRSQNARLQLLTSRIQSRKELITQHLQGQAAERTEALTRNMEREAIVMRIVTLVTLIYLPATFVSTFFSTDIVKYQNQSDGIPDSGSFSEVALVRWLQVTVPLTALTLLVAWGAYRMAEKEKQHLLLSHKFGKFARLFTRVNQRQPSLPLFEKQRIV